MTPTDRALLLLRLRETCGVLADLCRLSSESGGQVRLAVEEQQIRVLARMDGQVADLSRAALAEELANLDKEDR